MIAIDLNRSYYNGRTYKGLHCISNHSIFEMAWLQRSNKWDLLEELIEEERRRSEWKIGQHPLLGLDDFMEDMLQFPIPLCEEKNCAQTGDSPHESSVCFNYNDI